MIKYCSQNMYSPLCIRKYVFVYYIVETIIRWVVGMVKVIEVTFGNGDQVVIIIIINLKTEYSE